MAFRQGGGQQTAAAPDPAIRLVGFVFAGLGPLTVALAYPLAGYANP
jgi:hypothetical protein